MSTLLLLLANRTPAPGQSQDGMTPQAGGGMTPRGVATPGLTPGRTPLRDKLNINTEDQLADPAFAKHLVRHTPLPHPFIYAAANRSGLLRNGCVSMTVFYFSQSSCSKGRACSS